MSQQDRKPPLRRTVLKILAHRVVFPATEGFNILLFRLAGFILRPVKQPVTFTGGARVLVIAPHPDDETLGCGGTIACHARAGDEVRLVIVTDGGRSRALGLPVDRIVPLRRAEAKRAIAELQPPSVKESRNIDLEQWLYPEGNWNAHEVTARIRALLVQFRPDIIYTVSLVDFHPEHLAVARCVAQAISTQEHVGSALRLRIYELQVPLTPVLVNRLAHVGQAQGSKDRALAQYTTQQGSFQWVRRHCSYLRALNRTRTSIEAFWEMDVRQFCRLHSENDRPGSFRSIRLRPFTDILAWLIGARSRRKLRLLIDEAGTEHG